MKPEEKIYRAYFESKKPRLYFNEIKKLTSLSDSSLDNTLSKLNENLIIQQEKTKSNTYYNIKNKKIFALKFAEIAIQKFEQLNIGVKVPLRNFLKDIPQEIFTIVIFGSASVKEEKKESDIDLLVVSNKKLELKQNKKEAEKTSKYPITIFECFIEEFMNPKDDLVIQAKKTGFPIYKEQNFYEVITNEY